MSDTHAACMAHARRAYTCLYTPPFNTSAEAIAADEALESACIAYGNHLLEEVARLAQIK